MLKINPTAPGKTPRHGDQNLMGAPARKRRRTEEDPRQDERTIASPLLEGFSQLPEEFLRRTFGLLSQNNLFRAAHVCRNWRAIAFPSILPGARVIPRVRQVNEMTNFATTRMTNLIKKPSISRLVLPLNEDEQKELHSLLSKYKSKRQTVDEKDCEQLAKLTAEVKAIDREDILHQGKKIEKARILIKKYHSEALSAWLMAVYGTIDSSANYLRWYKLYKALPGNLRPKFTSMPKSAAYNLARKEGDHNQKEQIIENYKGGPLKDLNELIDTTFGKGKRGKQAVRQAPPPQLNKLPPPRKRKSRKAYITAIDKGIREKMATFSGNLSDDDLRLWFDDLQEGSRVLLVTREGDFKLKEQIIREHRGKPHSEILRIVDEILGPSARSKKHSEFLRTVDEILDPTIRSKSHPDSGNSHPNIQGLGEIAATTQQHVPAYPIPQLGQNMTPIASGGGGSSSQSVLVPDPPNITQGSSLEDNDFNFSSSDFSTIPSLPWEQHILDLLDTDLDFNDAPPLPPDF